MRLQYELSLGTMHPAIRLATHDYFYRDEMHRVYYSKKKKQRRWWTQGISKKIVEPKKRREEHPQRIY